MAQRDLPPAARTHPTRPARRPPLKNWRAHVIGGALGVILLVGGLLATDHFTRRSVTLEINGTPYHLRTHADTVQAALDEAGIALASPDRVWPSPQTALEAARVITVRKADDVAIVQDGQLQKARTLKTHPLDILTEQGIAFGPYDTLIVDGAPYTVSVLSTRTWNAPPQTVRLVHSTTITVQDGDHTLTLHTIAPDVARALENAGLKLYLADRVIPTLETPISPDLHVTIERAVPLTVIADGRRLHTRARGPTVADALVMIGVVPLGLDYTIPPLDAPLEAEMTIRVVRVAERVITQEETIPFLTLYNSDDISEFMSKRDVTAGALGVRTTTWCVRYEDGQEVWREKLDERFIPHSSSFSTLPCGEQRLSHR